MDAPNSLEHTWKLFVEVWDKVLIGKRKGIETQVIMERASKELQRQLELEVDNLRTIQKDISKSHQMSRQYTLQHSENEVVKRELDLLEEDAVVYKLIGPVLVKQDLLEAKANVAKRIEYISTELKRLENTLKSLEQKESSKREDVMKVQQRLQTSQSPKQ